MSSKGRIRYALVVAAVAGPVGLAAWSGIPPEITTFTANLAHAAPFQPPSGPTTAEDGADEPKPKEDSKVGSPGLRKLTNEEISRLRFLELRGMRFGPNDRPDRVIVKISSDVVEDFLTDMEGHPNYRGEQTRREFHKLTPPQKLHHLAYWKGAKYADRVQILSDPEVFVSFKKNVLPTVIRGCGQAVCHSATNPDQRISFRLYNDPKRSPSTTYANFVMLNDVRDGTARLIDRAHPENSLLLTCMLPAKDVIADLRHPGGIELTPVFRTTKSIGYRRILKWITMLKHPAEEYGVHLLPDAEWPASEEDRDTIDAPRPPGDDKELQRPGPSNAPTDPPRNPSRPEDERTGTAP